MLISVSLSHVFSVKAVTWLLLITTVTFALRPTLLLPFDTSGNSLASGQMTTWSVFTPNTHCRVYKNFCYCFNHCSCISVVEWFSSVVFPSGDEKCHLNCEAKFLSYFLLLGFCLFYSFSTGCFLIPAFWNFTLSDLKSFHVYANKVNGCYQESLSEVCCFLSSGWDLVPFYALIKQNLKHYLCAFYLIWTYFNIFLATSSQSPRGFQPPSYEFCICQHCLLCFNGILTRTPLPL